MPQEKVELAHRFFAAWNEQGVAGVTLSLADEIEWHDPSELPDSQHLPGTRRG